MLWLRQNIFKHFRVDCGSVNFSRYAAFVGAWAAIMTIVEKITWDCLKHRKLTFTSNLDFRASVERKNDSKFDVFQCQYRSKQFELLLPCSLLAMIDAYRFGRMKFHEVKRKGGECRFQYKIECNRPTWFPTWNVVFGLHPLNLFAIAHENDRMIVGWERFYCANEKKTIGICDYDTNALELTSFARHIPDCFVAFCMCFVCLRHIGRSETGG